MRGEPDLPTPPHIAEACNRAIANGRTNYPDNRGEKKFREALIKDLKVMLDDSKDAADNVEMLIGTVSKKHAVHAELLSRAMTRLGLMKTYAR